MKHAQKISRFSPPIRLPKPAFCEPFVDGFCYTMDIQNGMKGILVTGGFAGVSEFHPLFPSIKSS